MSEAKFNLLLLLLLLSNIYVYIIYNTLVNIITTLRSVIILTTPGWFDDPSKLRSENIRGVDGPHENREAD